MPVTLNDKEGLKLHLAAEILRCCGTVHLKALGASMLPSIWPGDVLTIQSQAHEGIVPGDVVLVLREGRFFVHRLIEKREGQDGLTWITRGDAMPDNDPPATASDVLGRLGGIWRTNRSFIPSRRVPLVCSALAWMLRRSDRLRNLTLRLHALVQQAGSIQVGQFIRHSFRVLQDTPGISPSRPSHL